MHSLYKLRDNKENQFDYVLVAHSVSLKQENKIIMDGPKKLAKYIRYREGRLLKLEEVASELCSKKLD